MSSLKNNPLIKVISSLRLTLVLLGCSMVLIFVATLDQVHMGIRGAQKEYFESLGHFWQYPEQWPGGENLTWLTLPIPGGYLVGPLLFLNLVAAHAQRFRLTWKKAGIQCIHLGIILLLLGQLGAQLLQVESKMVIDKGERANFISRFHEVELAFVNVSDPTKDEVVAIPEDILQEGGTIRHPDLPFNARIRLPDCQAKFSTIKAGKRRKLRLETWLRRAVRHQSLLHVRRGAGGQDKQGQQGKPSQSRSLTFCRNTGRTSVSNQGFFFSHALLRQLGCGVGRIPASICVRQLRTVSVSVREAAGPRCHLWAYPPMASTSSISGSRSRRPGRQVGAHTFIGGRSPPFLS